MTNFGKLVLTLALLFVFAVVFALMQRPKSIEEVKKESGVVATTDSSPLPAVPAGDLVSFSIPADSNVSGKMSATGSIQNGYFFEGNILVNIVDQNKHLLKAGHGTATSDWMTAGPVSFKTELDFTGLPKGPANIEIKNDNPSGNAVNDKFILIPINIQ